MLSRRRIRGNRLRKPLKTRGRRNTFRRNTSGRRRGKKSGINMGLRRSQTAVVARTRVRICSKR